MTSALTSMNSSTVRCLDCDTLLDANSTSDYCRECERWNAINRSVRAFRRYNDAGFPLHALAALAHDESTARGNEREELRNKVASLLAGTSERSTLFITGSVGTGKTVEASRAGLAVILAGGTAQFVTSSDYLARIRGAYGDGSGGGAEQIVAKALATPLLVLDDLGVERATAHAVARLLELIDARYRSMKPMIITSNFSLGDLAAHLAGGASHEERADARENARRLCDRLQEIATGAHIRGASYRKTSRQDTWARLRRIVAAMEAERGREYPRVVRSLMGAAPRNWQIELVEVMPDLADIANVVDHEIFGGAWRAR